MASKQTTPFKPMTFLARAGDGTTTLQCQKHQTLFTQGDAANAVFYIVEGWIKLTVISPQGKEAVIAILEQGDFFGEACLAGQLVCMATATSFDASKVVRIHRAIMTRILYNESAFSGAVHV
jgi:CRP-like cAMP-binding protein